MQTDVAILVASCDRYSDLWPAAVHMLQKNGPDLKTYLSSNHLATDSFGITPLQTGDDVSWSANLRTALEMIPESYVLLMLEDLFPVRPINSGQVLRLVQQLMELDGHCLKLNPVPPANSPFDDVMGVVSAGVPYRVSTVATVWRRQTLLELLDPAENAWQFEIAGSVRSSKFPGFYACRHPQLPVINAVVRGKWRKAALRAALLAGAPVDRGARPVMNNWEAAGYKCALLRHHVLQFLPPTWRSPVREMFVS